MSTRRPITRLIAVAAPLVRANVDTDQIIPARFMRRPRRPDGYGGFLLHDLRFDREGAPIPDFVLNRASFRDATALVTGPNFGCGSSREAAVYALMDHGIRVVVAAGFGDIFRSNALKNGLLPVDLDPAVIERLLVDLERSPGSAIEVDLEARAVTLPDGSRHSFEIDDFSRDCLLRGVDELDLARAHAPETAAYERQALVERPWTAGLSPGK